MDHHWGKNKTIKGDACFFKCFEYKAILNY